MRIFIEPTEPLLFRTGRPFDAGESNFAESIFPPTPETLQGALRAMIAVQSSKSRQDRSKSRHDIFSEPKVVELIGRRSGDHNIYGRFRITGSTLGRRDEKTKKVERLFPAPAHIIQTTVTDDSETTTKIVEIVRLVPRNLSQEVSNHPAGTQLLFPDLEGKKTAGKSKLLDVWLTPQGLQLALSEKGLPRKMEKKDREKYLVPTHEIYEKESRLGIGMNNATKTTEEGYLYQVQMIRMQKHYGFVVDVEFGDEQYGASELPHDEQRGTPPELASLREGWLTLGGEQRAARFQVLRAEEIAEEEGISQTTPGRLLYFATPTYFKNGWLPQAPNILPAKPISAALERYKPIGGWLLTPGTAGGASKLTRRCVPAGSVYYFDKPVSVTQPLTEYGWQIGYGIAYTGEY